MPQSRLVATPGLFFEQWVDGAPNGTGLLHAQLYPAVYPTDAVRLQELREAGQPAEMLVPDEYTKKVQWLRKSGILVRRLVMCPDAGSPNYQAFWESKQHTLPRLVGAGEDVRLTTYGRHQRWLRGRRPNSPIARAYAAGIREQTPAASFLAVTYPNLHGLPRIPIVWLMHYGADGFAGGAVYDRYEPQDDIARWYGHWRRTYDRSPAFTPSSA